MISLSQVLRTLSTFTYLLTRIFLGLRRSCLVQSCGSLLPTFSDISPSHLTPIIPTDSNFINQSEVETRHPAYSPARPLGFGLNCLHKYSNSQVCLFYKSLFQRLSFMLIISCFQSFNFIRFDPNHRCSAFLSKCAHDIMYRKLFCKSGNNFQRCRIYRENEALGYKTCVGTLSLVP